jgi:ribosomal protein S18 acetylase RimI-like enzyme
MPVYSIIKLEDKNALRNFLEKDRGYAAYALGDLEAPYDQHATWFGARAIDNLEGLALIYGEVTPPMLFLMGSNPAISALLTHGVGPGEVYFNTQPDQQPLLETWYTLQEPTAMYRMQVTKAKFKPSLEAKFPIRKLDSSKIDEINNFFKLGAQPGERIIPFTAEQVKAGFFHGIYLEERLIGAAGTHMVAKQARLAALGNVMTHPGYRGKGLGKAVSNAVITALFEANIETVALSVAQDNKPAIAIYEALGFERSSPFIEGQARRN